MSSKKKPKKPAAKKPAPKKPAPKKPAPKAKKPAAKPAPKKPARAAKKPAKVTAVRRDARGRFHDVKTGRPVPAARAKRFKTFFDAQGRKRNTKGGLFAKGTGKAPTRAASRRKGLVSAFRPSKATKRGAAQEKLLRSRAKRKGRPKVVDMRFTGAKRTEELARMFGIDLRVRGDFAVLVEAQGVELGRASFSVTDPIGSKDDLTILRGVERATRSAMRDVPAGLVAVMTRVFVEGREVGAQTAIVRSDERHEVVGGVMSSVFSILGENGLDASDGTDGELEPVNELEVEIAVYELE